MVILPLLHPHPGPDLAGGFSQLALVIIYIGESFLVDTLQGTNVATVRTWKIGTSQKETIIFQLYPFSGANCEFQGG